MSSKVPRKYIG